MTRFNQITEVVDKPLMLKSLISIFLFFSTLEAFPSSCFRQRLADLPCNISFLTCYDPSNFELTAETLENLSRYPTEISEEITRKFPSHDPSIMIEQVKNGVGEKLLPLFLSDKIAPRWGEALEILKEFELNSKTPYAEILEKLKPFIDYRANIDGYRNTRKLAESMRRSGRFKFFRAGRPLGEAEEPITASTFIPGESYTVNISRKNMFMIGAGFRKKNELSPRSHAALQSAQYPDSTFRLGGSMRITEDGSLQISGYFMKTHHKTKILEEYVRSLDIDVRLESFEGPLPGLKGSWK